MIHDVAVSFDMSNADLIALPSQMLDAPEGAEAVFPPRIFYPLPGGLLGTKTMWDLQVIEDVGRGTPIIFRLEVTTAITSSDAGLTMALGFALATDQGFSVDTMELGVSEFVPLARLGIGAAIEFPLPPTGFSNAIVGPPAKPPGRRYVYVGIVVQTATIINPNPLFTAGAFRLRLVLNGQNDVATPFPAGWNAAGV
jgi:hypothetical protein